MEKEQDGAVVRPTMKRAAFFGLSFKTQIFTHVLHWRPYVIHRGLYVILCHSGLKMHNSQFDCMTSGYRCNFGPHDKSNVVQMTFKPFLDPLKTKDKKCARVKY